MIALMISHTSALAAGSSMMSSRFPWNWSLAELPAPVEDAPTVFSCFACGGGSSMGYKRAGFNVLGNCEIDPTIAAVYSANLHPRFSFIEDIRDFVERDDLPQELFYLDVLDGSPPCSTFSMAGEREAAWGKKKKFAEGQKLQTLDDLFFIFLDVVEKLQPKVFVAENVKGLILGKARGYVKEINKKARSLGYEVQLFLLNASSMGVPQRRERVFFIGNRMHYKPLQLSFNEPQVTFGEVRSNHGNIFMNEKGEYKRLLEFRKPGDKSIADIIERLKGVRSGMNNIIVSDDVPAQTITSGGNAYRMYDGMRLSLQDYRNCSSFPQDYQFLNKSPKFICGMSVPPSMMANVAYEIKRQWLDD